MSGAVGSGTRCPVCQQVIMTRDDHAPGCG